MPSKTVTPVDAVSTVPDIAVDSFETWLQAQQQWFAQMLAMQQAWNAAWWNWQLGWMQPASEGAGWVPPWARWYNGSEQLA